MKIPWGSWLGSMLPKNKFKGIINILVKKKKKILNPAYRERGITIGHVLATNNIA